MFLRAVLDEVDVAILQEFLVIAPLNLVPGEIIFLWLTVVAALHSGARLLPGSILSNSLDNRVFGFRTAIIRFKNIKESTFAGHRFMINVPSPIKLQTKI